MLILVRLIASFHGACFGSCHVRQVGKLQHLCDAMRNLEHPYTDRPECSSLIRGGEAVRLVVFTIAIAGAGTGAKSIIGAEEDERTQIFLVVAVVFSQAIDSTVKLCH